MRKRMKEGGMSFGQSMQILFRMWNYVKQYRFRFYVGFLLGNFGPLFFSYMNSYIVKQFTAVSIRRNFQMFGAVIWKIVLLEMVGLIVFPIAYGMIYTTYARISGVVKKNIFAKAQSQSVSAVSKVYSGDLMNCLTADFNAAIQLVAYPGVGQGNPFALVLTILLTGVIVIVSNPLLGVISLVCSLISIFITNSFVKPLQKKENKVKEATGKAAQGIINSLSGAMVSRMYGLDHILSKQYEEKSEEILQNNVSLIQKKSILFLFTDMQSFISFAGVTAIGLFLSYKGYTDIPTVVFISTMQMSLGNYLSELSQKYADLQQYIIGAQRLFRFLDSEEEEERMDRVQADYDLENVVEIKNLSFAYDEKTVLFDQFCLTIKKGEKLAVVGGSGGGKTTLYKLMLEFIKKNGGEIRLFGHAQEEYSVHTVRSMFSYVPQDCYLFDTSIYENVRLGKPDATDEEIKKALEDAYLTDFIETLPDGMYTEVGERGSKLSGGQKQRVAIARAFLKNAPIILLDEATSALDSRSEQEVQTALNHLLEGRTGVIVAHRLSTIENCDRIIVLEKGMVVEEGNHKKLLELDGRYRQLFEMQFA